MPGITAASYSENGIFSGRETMTSIDVAGFTAVTRDDSLAHADQVGPDYFHAIGAHIVQGRDILATDDATGAPVAVVNQSFASHYFPHGDAVGHRVDPGGMSFEIVGVVADIHDHGLREPPVRRVYFPLLKQSDLPAQVMFEIHTSGDPAPLVAPIRTALAAADPALAVLSVDPLPTLIGGTITQDRLVTRVLTFFGVLALVLAALGLYGVMAYTTLRRTSEFGIRMALGAESANVVLLVLGEVALLVAGGTLLGLPLAILGTRLLKHQLFGVQPVDPPSLIAAVVIMATSGAVAGLIPALRAARVGPLEALRTE